MKPKYDINYSNISKKNKVNVKGYKIGCRTLCGQRGVRGFLSTSCQVDVYRKEENGKQEIYFIYVRGNPKPR